jgi:hypothetical protein
LQNPEVFGPAMLGVTQGITAFTTLIPPLADIRKADPTDTSFAADVRMGEVAAVAMTMGVGVISSSLTGSAVPAGTAVLMCLVLLCVYETALRGDRPFEAKTPLPENVTQLRTNDA